VAYEALARGPRGSALETPDRLFAAARETGLLTELDRACRSAAFEGARAGGLAPPVNLFVNIEPEAIAAAGTDGVDEELGTAWDGFRVVLEVTERALTRNPAGLLRGLEYLRDLGFALALDDVGADPRSLALMPFVAPEVIKLDLRLVQARPSADIAAIVHAVGAEAERTGAAILAEGIETEEHADTARTLGARFGQGWLYGRPGPLPRLHNVSSAAPGLPRLPTVPVAPRETPFEVIRRQLPVRRGEKNLLLSMSRHLERIAPRHDAVILSTFQEARHFGAATRERYSELARTVPLVAALGVGLSAEPGPGIRGVELSAAEPLRGEWDVIVLGPHFSAAFVARDIGDDGPDDRRRFDFALTYDRELVTRAAASMMARIAAA
jgi:EAL domain-containing protein (putative c-di-GMP-specific phosphodiesterase class I)